MTNYANNSITLGADGNLVQNDTGFEDLRFPLIGRRMSTAAGHLDYNYAELGVDYDDSSRLHNADALDFVCQLEHSYKFESTIYPHLHWAQSHANIPNWLIGYRVYENGAAIPGTWDYAKGTEVAAYSSGTILQITNFTPITMSGIDSLSAIIDFKLYRDTSNTSTLFAGGDPLSGDALAKEFDVHFQKDTPCGSAQEYVK